MSTNNVGRRTVINVDGDGNCFFYALYGAAVETGNLGRLARCMLSGTESVHTDVEFSHRMRNSIADWIMTPDSTAFLKHAQSFIAATLQGAQRDYSAHVIGFSKYTPARFKKALSDYIRRDKMWMEEIYIKIVQIMMKSCGGLKLLIDKGGDIKYIPGPDTLVLVHVNGNHYKYAAPVPSLRRRRSAGRSPSNSLNSLDSDVLAGVMSASRRQFDNARLRQGISNSRVLGPSVRVRNNQLDLQNSITKSLTTLVINAIRREGRETIDAESAIVAVEAELMKERISRIVQANVKRLVDEVQTRRARRIPSR